MHHSLVMDVPSLSTQHALSIWKLSIAPFGMPVCVIAVVLILTPMVSHAIAPSYHQRTVNLTLYVSCNPKDVFTAPAPISTEINATFFFGAGWHKCENASFDLC